MARLMLTVGDFQAWVQPVPGSVSEWAALLVDEGHPLAAGDHEIGFYEPGSNGEPDNHISAICSENDALVALGAWLMVDTSDEAYSRAEQLLCRLFNPTGSSAIQLGWLFP